MSWREERLGDLAKFLSGGTPSKSLPNYWGGEIPWVSAKDLKQHFIFDSGLHITNEGAENGTKQVPENTILFVVRGMSLASEFRVSLSKVPLTFNQDLKALICKEGINPRFLFYALVARKEQIRQLAGEASHGTKKLPTSVIEGIKIKIPVSEKTQERIAYIAEQYDFLIENNRRRIQLLEESARLLYKEWFVHLRFPGHEHVDVVDSVPEGWSYRRIDSLGDVVTGKTPSTKQAHYYGGSIPFVKTPDMHNNVFVISTEQCLSDEGANTQPKKYIPKGSLMISCIGTIGVVSLNYEICQTNQQINAVIPHGNTYRSFLLFALKDLKLKLEAFGSGATMMNINKAKFSSVELLTPESKLIEKYEETVADSLAIICNLQLHNQKLAQARDLLLPKLMNGELTV